jgi:hypothetical protein
MIYSELMAMDMNNQLSLVNCSGFRGRRAGFGVIGCAKRTQFSLVLGQKRGSAKRTNPIEANLAAGKRGQVQPAARNPSTSLRTGCPVPVFWANAPNKANFRRFWPKNEGGEKSKANSGPLGVRWRARGSFRLTRGGERLSIPSDDSAEREHGNDSEYLI